MITYLKKFGIQIRCWCEIIDKRNIKKMEDMKND